MLILILAVLELAWPIFLKALGILTTLAFSFFINAVIEECSEDTVK